MRAQGIAVVLVATPLLINLVISQDAPITEKKVFNSLDQLVLDENGRLANHALLYKDTAACQMKLDHYLQTNEMNLREPIAITGVLAEMYFGNSTSDCAVVCLQRGLHYNQLPYPIPNHVDLTGQMGKWIDSKCQKTEIGFILYAAEEADTYWINRDGERQKVGHFKKGEKNTAWHTSYLGHVFEVVDSSNGDLLGRYTVEYDSINPIGFHPSQVQERDVTALVRNTFSNEWQRAHRVKRTFTEFGFDKGRLPEDLWGSMSQYYYNNQNNTAVEEWGSKGVFVNWWEKDVYFLPMPWSLKKYWQGRLKDLVEAWSGVELELTDIYGMRRYEDGARLLTHVDREATHAASLIINIAQGEMREPWNVEIYDFANRLHEIPMDPGDIVYYESARCLHGRMQALQGAYYVNLFAHYRPIGDPEWFKKENPSETPQQALDLGECSSNGTATTCTTTEFAPRYLSPKMETLKGSNDLFSFWQNVSPQARAQTQSSDAATRDEL